MKKRLFTGLAAALVLGGCASYDYVDRGGGYYTGSSPRYGSAYGSAYGGYGYGSGYYGSSYLGYRYRPGWSFGLDYGYPGYWSPYPGGTLYYGGSYYPRPPQHRPHPPHYPPRPGDHDQRPVPPPSSTGSQPPRLDRAPWRDLERLKREREGRNPGRPMAIPVPESATSSIPVARPRSDGLRPGTYQGQPRPMERPRSYAGGDRPPTRYRAEGGAGSPRAQQAPQRSMSRSMPEPRQRSVRSATPDTNEP